MARINWKEEAPRVKEYSLEGLTLFEIGEIYHVSRSRIGQVIQKYFPTLSSRERGAAIKAKRKEEQIIQKRLEKTGRTTGRHETDLSRAMTNAFRRKKQNARKTKWEWDISYTDIKYPLICPILGIELDWFSPFKQDNSPSFDRIDATKGYIKGNVIVCSWRANRIKNDGTAKELRQIADFLDNLGGS